MPPQGRLRSFDLKYNFEVNIENVGEGAFATCSEPVVAVGEALLWQGGSIIAIKEPTRLTFTDVTLERGMSNDLDLWNWLRLTGNAASNRGTAPLGYKRTAIIYQKRRDGFILEMITLYNAWPKEYSAGDWNNDADEFRMERIVLAYDWFDRLRLGG